MSTSIVPKEALSKIGTEEHITIEFTTNRRATHSQSEWLCNEVEKAFAQNGINVSARGGTNYGTSIAIDVYKK